jgi:alpha/beta superfamily hydrolase
MNNPPARSVVIVHNTYGKISGEEIVIDNLAALLAKRGITVLRFDRYKFLSRLEQ